MPVNTLSRLLPYLLLTFVGVAGWAMQSAPLLAMVVLGTVGVSVGTTIAAAKNAAASKEQQTSGS